MADTITTDYLSLPSDAKIRGRYRKTDIPNTEFPEEVLEELALEIEDDIHAALSEGGVVNLPLNEELNPKGYRRLKTLARLGLNANIELELKTRINTEACETEKEIASKSYLREFREKLSQYAENPRYTLLQGDTDFTCLSDRIAVRPIGNSLFSSTSDLFDSGELDFELKTGDEY